MADELLLALDRAFAEPVNPVALRPRRGIVMPFAAGGEKVNAVQRSLRERVPWLDIFVGIQFLWGMLLFVPGAQEYRAAIRALPYASSLGLLALYLTAPFPQGRPWGIRFLTAAMVLLATNLLHATSPMYAGIAQCVFQLSIAAPMFWAYKAVRTPRQLQRIILLVFLLNGASAVLGVLQVYYPDTFMPPQFSALGLQLNDYYVDSMTYKGSDGRMIVRPPGLSDMPGGAAVAGAFVAVLGLGLSVRAKNALHLLGSLVAAAVGLAVIYLTQVRSVLMMVIAALAILCGVALRQRRVASGLGMAAAGGALVVAAFFWATSVGGESVEERFLTLRDQGAMRTFQEGRGTFFAQTTGELLDAYPLGAGVGRWGMMNAYFGNPADVRAAPIYVEIQLTGWLLDGGVPMWMLYGGAVGLSLLGAFRLTGSREPDVRHGSLVIMALLVLIAGMGMAGPVFNTQLGVVFWMLTAALQGTASTKRAKNLFAYTDSPTPSNLRTFKG